MSKMIPPRGPPGYNGTQGPAGSPGPSGPRGSPGPGANLSLCRYQKEKSASVTSDVYARTTVSVTEQKVGFLVSRQTLVSLITQSSHWRRWLRDQPTER